MARLGVTYQDIANAASQIQAQGRQPTIELIRHHLGTGSSTTIANHLRQWRADQEVALPLPANDTIPQEMIGMLKGLWERLNVEVDQKATEIEVKTQQEVALLLQEIEKYKTNNRRWQKLFNHWQLDKAKRLSENLLQEKAIQQLQEEKRAVESKLEAQTRQLLEKRIRIEELHRMHSQYQTNLENDRAERLLENARLAEYKQQKQQELNSLNEQVVVTKEKLADVQQAYKILKQNLNALEVDYEKLSNKSQNQAADILKLQISNVEYIKLSELWERQCNEAKQLFNDLAERYYELQTENKLLSFQLNETKSNLQVETE